MDKPPSGPLSHSERAEKRTQHGVHPSQELAMNVTVYDDARAPDVPQLKKGGKPTSQTTTAPARADSPKWLVPALLVLSVVPLAAGGIRVTPHEPAP